AESAAPAAPSGCSIFIYPCSAATRPGQTAASQCSGTTSTDRERSPPSPSPKLKFHAQRRDIATVDANVGLRNPFVPMLATVPWLECSRMEEAPKNTRNFGLETATRALKSASSVGPVISP